MNFDRLQDAIHKAKALAIELTCLIFLVITIYQLILGKLHSFPVP